MEKYHDNFFPSNGEQLSCYKGKQTKLKCELVHNLKDIISIRKKYVDNNINNLYSEYYCDHLKKS